MSETCSYLHDVRLKETGGVRLAKRLYCPSQRGCCCLVPCRLGIYSSATRPTVTKALHKLHGNLANFMLQRRAAAAAAAGGSGAAAGAAASGGKKKRKKAAAAAAAAAAGVAAGAAVDAEGFPLELPKQLFEVVMARDHCVPAAKVQWACCACLTCCACWDAGADTLPSGCG